MNLQPARWACGRRRKRPRRLWYVGAWPGVLIFVLLFHGSQSYLAQRMPPSENTPGTVLAASGQASFPCERPGWFPDGLGLKDHTIFSYGGLYYIASIYLADSDYENRFAYASSPDLCQWSDLGGILKERPVGEWDEFRIWAPYVYQEGGVYYMFYTGVTNAFAQSIMLATSTDPAEPDSWERQGVVFQPSHAGSVWGGFDTWSDCRDPTVIKIGESYHLYYTGRDIDGGIIGLATAPSPSGPWIDWGAVVTTPNAMPESPTLTHYGGLYYLFYHGVGAAGSGQVYHYGPTLAGPWSRAHRFRPGWAHEIWVGQDGESYTSFLTDYSVSTDLLTWDAWYNPPHPVVGEAVYRIFVPSVVQ